MKELTMGLKWFLNVSFIQDFGHTNNVNVQQQAVTGPHEGGFQVLMDTKGEDTKIRVVKEDYQDGFQMPLHYPKYTKADYEKMEEWKVDMLLKEYGLSFKGTLDEKRAFAMGTFLWPDQV